MAASQKVADTANEALNQLTMDPWASTTTQVFALIGLLYLSVKIFSFWRMIASLFILPGTNVCEL
jgi:17beta-estradiol 17-dehydrogenase / very-long-chain 3-oxoacyl-CoA reductase